MGRLDPPSDDALALLHYLQDRCNYARSYPSTRSDASKLIWFFIKRLRHDPWEWPLALIEGNAGGVILLRDVAGVTSIRADANPALSGAVVLASGSGITLTEVGQTITVTNTQAAGALTLLADVTLGADAATIDTGANGIAAGHSQLLVETFLRTDEAVAGNAAFIRFNGDGGNNYDRYGYQANAAAISVVSSFGVAGILSVRVVGNTGDANGFGGGTVVIPNYASTTQTKSLQAMSEAIATAAAANCVRSDISGRWRSTAAINQISLHLNGGTVFRAGSRLTVYGAG